MFICAKPIYPAGMSRRKNTFALFRATVSDARGATLAVTARSFYQVLVNGKFVAFGPARTADGYARVDLLPINDFLTDGACEITVAVVGHFCRSLSTTLGESFVQAELVRDGEVLCATGSDFDAFMPPVKVRESMRYSIQRHFMEVWDFRSVRELTCPEYRVSTEVISDVPRTLPRRAPYAHTEDVLLGGAASGGTLVYDGELEYRQYAYSGDLTERWGRFEWDAIAYNPYEWIQRHREIKAFSDTPLPITLKEGEYAIFDFSRIEVGFIKLLAQVCTEADIVIGFSEDCSRDSFAFTNINACNAMEVLAEGDRELDFMSFEPYVGRYFIVALKKGEITLRSFGIKTFMHSPEGAIVTPPEDETLAAIYKGAIRTFNHNAVDIYMDCPSRERAGWLCDSYFTAKAEYAIYGESRVEDAFLENYRLCPGDDLLPEGALPMCYPSDVQAEHAFIPQWTMWYILEVEDYVNNRCHIDEKEKFRESIDKLLAFYLDHENEDGLLENLTGWNFIEWSAANKWVRNVNYPTNFLYSEALTAAYRLFGDAALLEKAERIRASAISQSFDGERFYDRAVRDGRGVLRRTDDCSEIAQYYAILFGGIDMKDEKYAPLRRLVTVRCAEGSEDYPENMEHINAFIGVYLRLEALLRMGEYELALSETKAFFGEMERETGTLWEFRERRGSRDHGFAAYALVVIDRALGRYGEN